MINQSRRTLKYELKMNQRDLNVMDLAIKKKMIVKDDKLNFPLDLISKRNNLLLKIKKLQRKLNGTY